MSCFFKKLDDGQVPKKKIASVNFIHAVLSLLDFMTLGERANRLSRNAGNELSLYAVKSQQSADLTG
jgi:hypothetical protein